MQNRCVLKNLNSSFNCVSGRWGLWKLWLATSSMQPLFCSELVFLHSGSSVMNSTVNLLNHLGALCLLCSSSSAVGLSGSTALGEGGSQTLPLQPILLLVPRTAWNAWGGRIVTRLKKKNNLSTVGLITQIVQVPINSYLRNSNAISRSHPFDSISIWQSRK